MSDWASLKEKMKKIDLSQDDMQLLNMSANNEYFLFMNKKTEILAVYKLTHDEALLKAAQ